MKDEIKNLYAAILLSALVIVVVSHYMKPKIASKPVVENVQTEQQIAPLENVSEQSMKEIKSSQEIISEDSRVNFENDAIKGSIRLRGARIDNLLLKKYKENLDEDSPDVELLAPGGAPHPYYSQFGWLSYGENEVKVPDENTIWEAKGNKLTPEKPITLEWDNGEGVKFINKISLDNNYMFQVEQFVENNTNKEIEIVPYALLTKNIKDDDGKIRVVHKGMIGVFNDKLKELRYQEMNKVGEKEEFVSKRSWAGFSDHYWFSALIFNNQKESKISFKHTSENSYQTDYILPVVKVQSGSSAVNAFAFYSGAKEIKLLDKYVKEQGIQKFDLAVDFGWYYFLTKPFFYILDFLYHIIGNMGWAILLFAALLRLCMFPIANKSFESMSKMRKFQPKIQELQERYKDNKPKLQQEMMNLYRKEKINPASGCLPMFIQIPVFFSLYKVLNISIEIRHAPFVGWIKDLSAPDPLVLSEILHIYIPSFFNVGVWPLLMGLTMFIQQKLNPAPANKDQARAFMLMPVIFTFMMGHFASGLIIYWTFSNILSLIQQKTIMYKNGVK